MKTSTGIRASLLSLLLSVALVSTRLVIYGPQALKDKFASNGNHRLLTLFRIQDSSQLRQLRQHSLRSVPCKRLLFNFLQIGRVYYNESNGDGCLRTNFTTDFSGDPDGILTPIFLVDRGNCTFV